MFVGGAAPPGARGRGDVQTRVVSRPAQPRRAKVRGGARAAPRSRPRRARSGLSSLYDPTKPLAGRALRRAALALTQLEIRPQAQGLRRQIRDTNLQARAVEDRVGDYYRQFGDLAAAGVTDTQSASDRTNAALRAITDGAQTAIGTAGDAAAAQTKPLADRGLDGGAFARLAAETAASRQVASQYGQAASIAGALQGGNFEGLAGASRTVGAARGREALGQIANAFARQNETPQAKLAELRGQRGALLTKNVGALREAERNYQLAVGTLGLNQQKLAADVANDAADRRQRRLELAARAAAAADARTLDVADFVARYGVTPGQLAGIRNPGSYLLHHAPYYTSRRRGRGATGTTLKRTQANAYYADIETAQGIAQQLRRQGFGTGEIRAAMQNWYYIVPVLDEDDRPKLDRNGVPLTQRYSVPRIEFGGTGYLANAAMDLVFRGGLSPANVKALHDLGLQNLRGRYRIL